MDDNFSINSYFSSFSCRLRANHRFKVEEERNFLRHIFCPNDWVVGPAPNKDGNGGNNQLQNIKQDGISKPNCIHSILGYSVLDAIHCEHKNDPNEVLGDDEDEGNIEFTESENVLPGFSTNTSVAVIIEAQRGNEDPNSSHNVRMQAGRDECVRSNQNLWLYVNIRSPP